jgi:hypothetical protein
MLFALGCTAPSSDTGKLGAAPQCAGPSATTAVWVVDTLMFTRIEDGVSDGFDLDGLTSTTGGADGCGRQDQLSPDGSPGIDNAFGELIPALENTEFVSAEALINDTIRTGELMLVPWVDGLDDPVDDACVGVGIGRAVGEPMLGTDGNILAGQTLALDDSQAVSVDGMRLQQATAVGRPVSTSIPVQILDAALDFRLADGAIRIDMLADGHAEGVVAGGINVAEVLGVAREQGIAQEVGDILESLLGVVADLAPGPDGSCTQISVTLSYTATPIYVFDSN